MGLRNWEDKLARLFVRRPFRDEAGRKRWFTRFSRAQPHHVRRVAVTVPGWPRLVRPLRVAFLSDFHVGSHAGDIGRLREIVVQVGTFAPDLVLYGGDFVDTVPFRGSRVRPPVIARVLGRLDAPLGCIAVIGNHDRDYGAAEVTEALRAQGIIVLADETHTLSPEGAIIDIVGIPDATKERAKARALLSAMSPDRPSLVLAHDPVWFRHLPGGPHLMLAGHTHGGQICLPFYGPIRNASRAPMRWSYGLIEEQGRRMYVTSGIGCSLIPLRVLMPPEWALIEVNGI